MVVNTPAGHVWTFIGLADDWTGEKLAVWSSECLTCEKTFYCLSPTGFAHEEEKALFPHRHCFRCRGRNVVNLSA